MNYEPYTNTWAAKWYLQPVCNTMQYIWGTDILLKYFQTGKFLWQAPVGGRVEFDEGSKPGLDFIGLNYYGRFVSGLLSSSSHADSLFVPCARVAAQVLWLQMLQQVCDKTPQMNCILSFAMFWSLAPGCNQPQHA